MSEEPKKPLMIVETVMDCGDGTRKNVTMPIHDKEIADAIRDGRYHGHSGFSVQAHGVDDVPKPEHKSPMEEFSRRVLVVDGVAGAGNGDALLRALRSGDVAPPPHVGLFDHVELDPMLLHSLPAGIHVVDQHILHSEEHSVRPSLKDLFVKQQDTTLVHSSYPQHWEDALCNVRAQVMADCSYVIGVMERATLKPKTLPNGVVIMRMKLPRKLKKRIRRRFGL